MMNEEGWGASTLTFGFQLSMSNLKSVWNWTKPKLVGRALSSKLTYIYIYIYCHFFFTFWIVDNLIRSFQEGPFKESAAQVAISVHYYIIDTIIYTLTFHCA